MREGGPGGCVEGMLVHGGTTTQPLSPQRWWTVSLEPGTVDVVSVAPADVPDTNLARWRCSRCRESFDVCDSYAVTHRTEDIESTAIVCPPCADLFSRGLG